MTNKYYAKYYLSIIFVLYYSGVSCTHSFITLSQNRWYDVSVTEGIQSARDYVREGRESHRRLVNQYNNNNKNHNEYYIDEETEATNHRSLGVGSHFPLEISSETLALEDARLGISIEPRYIGKCTTDYVLMWPKNSRYFWSYGYVFLKEDYPANCVMKYTYDHRSNPKDPYVRYGFRVTGRFEGPPQNYTHCNETDYVLLDDQDGHYAYFCGVDTEIVWHTGSSVFDFIFVSQPDSPRARGFKVKIESVEYCGGTVTSHDSYIGSIQSANFPANYPSNVVCNWLFDTADKTQITLECSVFKVNDFTSYPNGTTQCHDALYISYESGYSGSSSMSTYCAESLHSFKHKIFSNGNNLLVSFRSNGVNNDVGFKCSYELVLYGM